MTPQQAQELRAIKSGLDDGTIVSPEAAFLRLSDLLGEVSGSVPAIELLLASWNHPLQDTSLLGVNTGLAESLKGGTFGTLPGGVLEGVNAFNVDAKIEGSGGTTGTIGEADRALTEGFSPEEQFQQFLAEQGVLTGVQRLAAARRFAPAETAFGLQRIANRATGVPAEEQGTFLDFLRGGTSAADTQQDSINTILAAIQAGAGRSDLQNEALILANEQAATLAPGIAASGAIPQFREVAREVAGTRLRAQEAATLASQARGQQENPDQFTNFLLNRGGATPNIGASRAGLRQAFTPNTEGGFSIGQETVQDELSNFSRAFPLMQQLALAGVPRFLRDSVINTLLRRSRAFEAERPGGSVFGEYITGGNAFA